MKIPALLLALAIPAFAAPNELTPEEKADGFKLLFDGKTTEGWRDYKGKSLSDQVAAKDGELVLGAGSHDIVTNDQYENFELRFEYKIVPDGNTGVMWHVSEEHGAPYESGPEFQILDSYAKVYEKDVAQGNASGSICAITPAKKEWSKPAGEWNEATIKVEGTKLYLTLNGHVAADIDTTSDEWKQLLEKSKFSPTKFNTEKKGYICFQGHGSESSFRNVRIKTL
jgi:hypothetical protein